jgi:hypothetical protein
MSQEFTHNFTEVWEPGGTIFPADRSAADVSTGWLDMANHQRIVFLIVVGAIGQGATLDFRAWQARDANGTGALASWKTTAGALGRLLYPIDQLTDADDNSLIAVEIRAESLDQDYRYVMANMTVGGSGVLYAVIPLRGTSNFTQVPTTGWTQVVTAPAYP